MRYQRSSVGTIILLKNLSKKGGITPKNSFQSYARCHDDKHSKFGVDTLSTFCVMSYIKGFARRRQRSSDHNSLTFSSKQTS